MSDKRTRSPVLRAHITSGAARGNQSYAASNAARSRVRSHALTLASRIGAGRVVRRSPSVLQQAHGRKRGVGRDAKRLRGGIARDVGHSKVWRHLAAQGVRVVSLAENPLALGIAVAHGCLPWKAMMVGNLSTSPTHKRSTLGVSLTTLTNDTTFQRAEFTSFSLERVRIQRNFAFSGHEKFSRSWNS